MNQNNEKDSPVPVQSEQTEMQTNSNTLFALSSMNNGKVDSKVMVGLYAANGWRWNNPGEKNWFFYLCFSEAQQCAKEKVALPPEENDANLSVSELIPTEGANLKKWRMNLFFMPPCF